MCDTRAYRTPSACMAALICLLALLLPKSNEQDTEIFMSPPQLAGAGEDLRLLLTPRYTHAPGAVGALVLSERRSQKHNLCPVKGAKGK